MGGRPAPASFGASFAGRNASFCVTGWMRPRPTSSSGFEKAPIGTASAGHWMARRSSRRTSAPRSMSEAATSTATVLTPPVVAAAGAACMY